MAQIWLVEDQEEIFVLVKNLLPEHEVKWLVSLQELNSKLATAQAPALLLLDVSLDDGNGFQWVLQNKEQLSKQGIAFIFLTGAEQVSEKVRGLELGAVDYLSKSMDWLELKTRIQVKLRAQHLKKSISLGRWHQFNVEKGEITDQAGRLCSLTRTQAKLLAALARKLGESLTRDQILDQVWGENVHISPRAVDTHVCHLRKNLKEIKVPIEIENVFGNGYRMVLLDSQPE